MDMNIRILLEQIAQFQNQINLNKPFNDSLNQTIQDKLRVEWTYHSNAIEGNTLTLGETAFFLREGLTSEGRPLQDYLEASNHAEAIDVLNNIIQEQKPITEHFVKSLHQLLLQGIDHTYAKGQDGNLIKKRFKAGKYKTRPNHVLTLSGKVHHYTQPEQVQIEMENLIHWLNQDNPSISVIEKAVQFHYRFVSIHPFDDGNGRLARLLMNLILMQSGLPPCIIKNEHRRRYLNELEQADSSENLNSLVIFIAEELLATMRTITDIMQQFKVDVTESKLDHWQRKKLILQELELDSLSIGQIHSLLSQIKRPTLKKDLQDLVKNGLIKASGIGKGVRYQIEPSRLSQANDDVHLLIEDEREQRKKYLELKANIQSGIEDIEQGRVHTAEEARELLKKHLESSD